jgi:hypothetical protein
MLLYQIVETLKVPDQSILIEEIVKYKNSLLTIYGNDCFLMVTSTFNVGSYARIVSIGDGFIESVEDYVNTIPDLSEEDRKNEIELINFQSLQLKDL